MRKWIVFALMMVTATLVWCQDEEIGEGDFAKAKGWKKYNLTAYLTTGRTVEIKSKFNIDFCNKVMFLYDDKGEIIYPQNTTHLERKLKDGTVITGYPTDSLWLFPMFTGKISGYSSKPETKMRHLEYIAKGDRDLVEYELDTLRVMLKDNPEAYEYYLKYNKKRKKAKMINSLSFLVGLAHVYAPSPIKYETTSGNTTITKDFPVYPIGAGIGVLSAALVVRASKKNLSEAIRIYNEKK